MDTDNVLNVIIAACSTLMAIFIISMSIELSSLSRAEDLKAKSIADVYSNVCVVDTPTGFGTGTLLDTGFVLTSSHVVNPPHMDYKEVLLKFDSGSVKGRVVMYDKESDYALILPDKHISGGVKFSVVPHHIGQEIYTVGTTLGQPLTVSRGIISRNMRDQGRASCYVSHGNSGGGIFNRDGETMGVVRAVGLARANLGGRLYMSEEDENGNLHMKIFPLQIPFLEKIHNSCYFVTNKVIKKSAEDTGALWMLQPQDYSGDYSDFYKHWVCTMITVLLACFIAWRICA